MMVSVLGGAILGEPWISPIDPTAVSERWPRSPANASRSLKVGTDRDVQSRSAMRPVLGSILISACSSTPCDLTPLEDAPEAGPGEVRHGFVVDQKASVIATPSGVACLTCGTLFYLDGADVLCDGLAVADDGSAIVVVGTSVTGSRVRVGSRTFDDGPHSVSYVLNIPL